MNGPDIVALDVFLQPGEVYFGERGTRIRTLLGSCVSITFWHPRLLVGGMCHYMLPGRRAEGAHPPDGRYADEALCQLLDAMRAAGTRAHEYEAKLFGGGRMFGAACEGALDIGGRNVEVGRRLLRRYGLEPVSEHLAGVGHRNIVFDVGSGDVWVKHTPQMPELRNVA